MLNGWSTGLGHVCRSASTLACTLVALSATFAKLGRAQENGRCLASPARVVAPAGVAKVRSQTLCPVSFAASPSDRRFASDDDPSCGKVVGAFTLAGAGEGGLLGFASMLTFSAVVAVAAKNHPFHMFNRDQAVGAAIGTSTFIVGAPLGAYIGCSDRKARGAPILRALDSGAACPQRRSLDLAGGGLLGAGLALGLVSSVELSFNGAATRSASGTHVWRDAGVAMIPAVPAGVALGNLVWSRCLLWRFALRR
jgi:hypothetical protein